MLETVDWRRDDEGPRTIEGGGAQIGIIRNPNPEFESEL
jgi:hypothetical protein